MAKIGSFNTGFLYIDALLDKNWKGESLYEIVYYQDLDAGIKICEYKNLDELKIWIDEVAKVVNEVKKIK